MEITNGGMAWSAKDWPTGSRLRILHSRRLGGLISGGDIARWWGVSRSRVTELTAHPLFPRPVYASPRIKLYYADEVAAFRHRRRS
jgi:hypothetical protein